VHATSRTILVLFDIDGTLIDTAGAGVRGMGLAFERVHGRVGALGDVPIAGRTDRAILCDAFERQALLPTEPALAAVRDAYLEELPGQLAHPARERFGVLPGVHTTLEELEADPRFTVALLTGNFVKGAEIKLTHFDLWRRFAFGAYGDNHVHRRDLVPVAVARATEAGRQPAAVVVIGDTPLDIDCALAHGAVAVAVATGQHSVRELSDAGADLVVETLEALAPAGDRLHALCRAM
jgi:phosphoglycolate phosphatase